MCHVSFCVEMDLKQKPEEIFVKEGSFLNL
jgi:hypothetical protein